MQSPVVAYTSGSLTQNYFVLPLGRNSSGNYALESKLVKWEFMKAQNVLRASADSELPGSRRAAGEGPRIANAVMRGLRTGAAGTVGGVGGGVGGVGVGAQRGSVVGGVGGASDRLAEDMAGIFGPDSEFIEERFFGLNSQAERVSNFEDRLGRIVHMTKTVTVAVRKMLKNQNQVSMFFLAREISGYKTDLLLSSDVK